jgi:predicted dehydrogenase
MIRLALIGCGAWGWRYIPAALESGVAKVTHVVGASLSRTGAEHCLGLWNAPSNHWRVMLDQPIDAFIVATPPDTHEEICTTLLEAGRPVMVEKPFTLSVNSATRITEAVTRSGATLLVNHQHLFAPAYEKFRDIVRGGDWSIRSASGNDGPHRSYSALWDYGPHDVAMQLGLADSLDAARLYSVQRSMFEHAGDFLLSMSLGRQMTGLVHVWNNRGPKTRLLVAENARHHVTYDALAPAPLMMDGLPIEVAGELPLQRAIRHFAEVVRGGKPDWRFSTKLPMAVTKILADAERMTGATAVTPESV